MSFKKLLAIILVCSMVLFAFSGCTLILIGVGIAGILGNIPTEPTEEPTEEPTDAL